MDFSLTESTTSEEPPKNEAVPLLLPPGTEEPNGEEPKKPEKQISVEEKPVEEKPQLKLVEPEPEPEPPPKRKRGRPKKDKSRLEFENRKKKEAGLQPLWVPAEEEYKLTRELAELGWPGMQIAEALNVSAQQFAGALIRYPRLKEEFEAGSEESKGYLDKRLAWRPKPDDLKQVRYFAYQGLRQAEIAAKLGISRQAFSRRMMDTPQLLEAFEQGEGEFRAKLIEDSQSLLDNVDPALRHASQLTIFKLKAYCDLTDRKEAAQKVVHEGEVQHKHEHKLNAPEPVRASELSDFAKVEMKRAKEDSAQKLKAIEAQVVEE